MENKTNDVRESIEHIILKAYEYGSKVYWTDTKESDSDFILVVKSDDDNLEYSVNQLDTNCIIYSEGMFIKKIQEHHIDALECIFQREYDDYVLYFKLDKSKLRKAISSVSSNSYVKCKKKLAQGDIRVGKKSLFHSLRVLDFGIQIATYGKIIDYSRANSYYNEIFEMEDDWDLLHAKFKRIHNIMKSTFKLLAPLESESNEK